MNIQEVIDRWLPDLDRHVRESKGFEQESWINPLRPVDSVAAFALAQLLVTENRFDVCVAVAPEGHVFGYFFEKLGSNVLSVHVAYPPRECTVLDDLELIRDQRVLILEDDIASGTTLRRVIESLQPFEPKSIDLLLGRPKKWQVIENMPPEIGHTWFSEDTLDENCREQYETKFIRYFGQA